MMRHGMGVLFAIAACGGGRPARPIPPGAIEKSYAPGKVDDPEQTLDIYPPPRGTENAPIVVYVHGGAWHFGDKRYDIDDKVRLFRELGYTFISVDYRLSPAPVADPKPGRTKYPVHAQDVAAAFAYAHDHAAENGVDPTRMALLGHSAGAHLVALVATDPSLLGAYGLSPSDVTCTISFDTEAYDIPAVMVADTSTEDQRQLLRNAFGKDPDMWAAASPITHVRKGTGIGPFLLADRGGPERGWSLAAFRGRLEGIGVPVTVIDVVGHEHDEINARIGRPNDELVTPPIKEFLKDCFAAPRPK
jgi:arylformamidase